LRSVHCPHRPAPGTIVLDRGTTSRSRDFGLTAWARLHEYRLVHTGTLDVYLRPE